MMRRQPTLIPLSDADVQDLRALIEARKAGITASSSDASFMPAAGQPQQHGDKEMVINDFALSAEIAQAAEHLSSAS